MLRRTNSTRLRRTAPMILAVAGATLVLAHSINAIVEHQLAVIPSAESSGLASGEPSSPASDGSPQFVDSIKNSGLFELPISPPQTWSTESGFAAASPKPPLEVAKKVRLLGVVLGDRHDSAVLEDLSSKQQSLFHLHEEIPEVGEIRSITHDGIVIGQDDQEEWLPLTTPSDDPAHSVSPTYTPPPALKPFTPSNKRILDRREAAQAVGDPSQLMQQAHIVPFLKNGAFQGFRFDFVLPAGFFDKAGFQYGDVIQRVNGVEIHDPEKMLTIFKQLLNERVVKVDVMRHNRPTTVTYELQ
ncbi:MAG: hypothetical protein NNA21_12465 [Nitrospira sp.]|nr:hypothetical protein [Nitrospira sp.]MCP9463021.1 hypothetical protein [Nitrospira sp.]MCP9476128.1 hypothetical protein [Nitrospira sp.]